MHPVQLYFLTSRLHYHILRLGLPRWLSLVQDFMPLIYLTIIYFSAFYFLHKVSSRKNSYTLRHIQRNIELLTLQKLYNLSYNCDNILNIGESVKYFFLWNYYKSNIRLFSLFLGAFTHFKLYILKYKAPRVWRALMFLLGCFCLIFFFTLCHFWGASHAQKLTKCGTHFTVLVIRVLQMIGPRRHPVSQYHTQSPYTLGDSPTCTKFDRHMGLFKPN